MCSMTESHMELVRQGQALYDRELRPKLEPEHKGDYLVLDVGTGQYELDEDECAAIRRARAKKPHTLFYILRVGYPPERI